MRRTIGVYTGEAGEAATQAAEDAAAAANTAAARAQAAADAVELKVPDLEAKRLDAEHHAQQTAAFLDSEGEPYAKGARGWSQDAEVAKTGAESAKSGAESARDQAAASEAAAEAAASVIGLGMADGKVGTYASLPPPTGTGDLYAVIDEGTIYEDTGSWTFRGVLAQQSASSVAVAANRYGGPGAVLQIEGRRGGTFDWAASGTVDDGITFSAANGVWVRRYDGPVRAEWFNAAGDLSADDAAAIQAAFIAAENVSRGVSLTKGEYRLSQGLTLTTDLYSDGATLVPDGLYADDWLLEVGADDITIGGTLTFRDDSEHLCGGLYAENRSNLAIASIRAIGMGSNGARFSGCRFLSIDHLYGEACHSGPSSDFTGALRLFECDHAQIGTVALRQTYGKGVSVVGSKYVTIGAVTADGMIGFGQDASNPFGTEGRGEAVYFASSEDCVCSNVTVYDPWSHAIKISQGTKRVHLNGVVVHKLGGIGSAVFFQGGEHNSMSQFSLLNEDGVALETRYHPGATEVPKWHRYISGEVRSLTSHPILEQVVSGGIEDILYEDVWAFAQYNHGDGGVHIQGTRSTWKGGYVENTLHRGLYVNPDFATGFRACGGARFVSGGSSSLGHAIVVPGDSTLDNIEAESSIARGIATNPGANIKILRCTAKGALNSINVTTDDPSNIVAWCYAPDGISAGASVTLESNVT